VAVLARGPPATRLHLGCDAVSRAQDSRARHGRRSNDRTPRPSEIDWQRTIRANLAHWQPELKTLVPERLIGHGRRRRSLRDVILCIDQSGSMATSVVYSSIFAAVMASLPSLSTRMVVFDTAVVDLSADLRDPVDLLFGAQLGGGTDIHKALVYCEGLVHRPLDTVMLLISDLCEGGNAAQMLTRAQRVGFGDGERVGNGRGIGAREDGWGKGRESGAELGRERGSVGSRTELGRARTGLGLGSGSGGWWGCWMLGVLAGAMSIPPTRRSAKGTTHTRAVEGLGCSRSLHRCAWWPRSSVCRVSRPSDLVSHAPWTTRHGVT